MGRGSTAVGERIAQERAGKSLTQAALAPLIGVSRTTIMRWETGRDMPSLLGWLRLCVTLDMPPFLMLELDPDQGATGS